MTPYLLDRIKAICHAAKVAQSRGDDALAEALWSIAEGLEQHAEPQQEDTPYEDDTNAHA